MNERIRSLLSHNVTYRLETAHRDILHVLFDPAAAVRALSESGLDDLAFDDAAAELAQELGEAEAQRRSLRDPAVDISGRYGEALGEILPRPDNDEEMYQALDREYGR